MNKSNDSLFFYLKELMRSKLDNNYILSTDSPRKLFDNYELVIRTLEKNPFFLESLPDEMIFSSYIFIKTAIEKGYHIEENSRFRANEEFITLFIDISGKLPDLNLIDSNIFNNSKLKQKIIKILKNQGDSSSLNDLKKYKEDKEFALAYYESLFLNNIDLFSNDVDYPSEELMSDISFVSTFIEMCINNDIDKQKILDFIMDIPKIDQVLKVNSQIVDIIFSQIQPKNLKSFFEKICPTEEDLATFFSNNFTGILEELKQVYTKNQIAPYTLDSRLLGKGIPLFKLQQYAGDQEFQQKLLNLSPDKFMMFLILSKVNLSKTEHWNRFDYCLLENLSSNKYDSLLEEIFMEIKRNQFNNYNLGKLSVILTTVSEHNIFNITSIRELTSYDTVREEVCNLIISNPKLETDSDVKIYGKFLEILREYEPIDRIKFAILQKSFGMSLEDAEIILKNYGENIDDFNLVDESNINVIEQIKAICNILNCNDIELLQTIGKSLDFVNFDIVYGPFLFEEAKKVFENNLKENLYSPKESEYIGIYDGVKLYKMPVEFESIVKFGYPKADKNMWETSIKTKDDSKLFRRRHCASYTTGELLNPLYSSVNNPNGNTIFGFGKSIRNFHFGGMFVYDCGSPYYNSDEVYDRITEEKSKYMEKDDFVQNTGSNRASLYNEVILETLISDEKTGNSKKLMPEYIIYYKKTSDMTDQEREKDINWKNALAAAKEFGIPIVIIDCEEIRKNELRKIEEGIKQNYNDYKSIKKLLGQINNYISRYGDDDILKLTTKEELEEKKSLLEKNKPKRKFYMSKYKSIDSIISNNPNILEGDVAIAK